MLVKCKQQPSGEFKPLPEQDDESSQHHLVSKSFSLNNFLGLTRSISQDLEEQQRHEEQIRHEDREKDLRNIEIFLRVHQT